MHLIEYPVLERTDGIVPHVDRLGNGTGLPAFYQSEHDLVLAGRQGIDPVTPSPAVIGMDISPLNGEACCYAGVQLINGHGFRQQTRDTPIDQTLRCAQHLLSQYADDFCIRSQLLQVRQQRYNTLARKMAGGDDQVERAFRNSSHKGPGAVRFTGPEADELPQENIPYARCEDLTVAGD